jgi:hypothetical protein
MRQFIYSISATGYNLKNEKGQKLFEYCRNTFEYTLLENAIDITNMQVAIDNKIAELNKQYPRLKQTLTLTTTTYKEIDSPVFYTLQWDDKNHTTAFTMSARSVKPSQLVAPKNQLHHAALAFINQVAPYKDMAVLEVEVDAFSPRCVENNETIFSIVCHNNSNILPRIITIPGEIRLDEYNTLSVKALKERVKSEVVGVINRPDKKRYISTQLHIDLDTTPIKVQYEGNIVEYIDGQTNICGNISAQLEYIQLFDKPSQPYVNLTHIEVTPPRKK